MGTVTYFILHRVNYIASIYLAPQSGNTSSVLSLQSSARALKSQELKSKT